MRNSQSVISMCFRLGKLGVDSESQATTNSCYSNFRVNRKRSYYALTFQKGVCHLCKHFHCHHFHILQFSQGPPNILSAFPTFVQNNWLMRHISTQLSTFISCKREYIRRRWWKMKIFREIMYYEDKGGNGQLKSLRAADRIISIVSPLIHAPNFNQEITVCQKSNMCYQKWHSSWRGSYVLGNTWHSSSQNAWGTSCCLWQSCQRPAISACSWMEIQRT